MSKLLERLRGELNTTADLSHQIELSALIACSLARIGDFAGAQRMVDFARTRFPRGVGGVGTLWVMLAEGLIHLFQEQSAQALDRISRAQMLALSIGHRRIAALASAWRAHIEFENSKYPEMIESLNSARKNADECDHDANTRMAMVFFTAFANSGRTDLAQSWFLQAHNSAVLNGDQASVDALLYNRAAFVLGHLRVLNCMGLLDPLALKDAHVDVLSAKNLNALTEVTALRDHLQFLSARLAMLEGNYLEALSLLQPMALQPRPSSHNFDQEFSRLEICFCNFKLKNDALVEAYLQRAHLAVFDSLDLDERIVGIWMVLEMARSDRRFGEAAELESKLNDLSSSYVSSRGELVARIESSLASI